MKRLWQSMKVSSDEQVHSTLHLCDRAFDRWRVHSHRRAIEYVVRATSFNVRHHPAPNSTENRHAWKTPRIVEIAIGMEINT